MKTLTLVLALFLSTFSQAQTDPEQAIIDLKEGTLIVNLIVPTKKIAALRERGNKQASIELQEEIDMQNEAIKLAFTNNYTFGRLLFVYSYNMGALADGDPTVLFNAIGNKQSVMPNNYFFVEFNETTGRNIDGLVMKNRYRDDLKKPFPNFVTHYKPLRLGRRTFKSMVEILDQNLMEFYTAVRNRK